MISCRRCRLGITNVRVRFALLHLARPIEDRIAIERVGSSAWKDADPVKCRPFADHRDWTAMNRRPDLPQVLIPVDLARETDFVIGEIAVCPSRRQIAAGRKQETVQPRVMQVFVALVRAKGAVLSREELIESCWDSVIVGDDAINRCIAKVRQIAELASGGAAFEIETIPRVGYRLRTADEMSELAPAFSPALELSKTQATDAAIPDPSGESVRSPAFSIHTFEMHRVFLVAATTIALCIVAATILFWPARPTQWTVTRSEIAVASSLLASFPAISPDGTMLAYSAGRDIASRGIYLRRISGGASSRLTDDGYDDSSPTWSRDGSQVAYVAFRKGEPCRLMVTSVPASAPRELARCLTDERSQITWPQSGEQLYFLDRKDATDNDRIMRLDLASGRRTQMTHPPKGAFRDAEPVVAPNGKWIAFFRDVSGLDGRILLLDLKTGAERSLGVVNSVDGIGTAWSEDSKTLFVTPTKLSDFAVWAYPVGGGPPSRILSSPVELGRLSTGPNGLLAAEFVMLNLGLAKAPAAENDEPLLLAPEKSIDHSPDIARNGTIVFSSERPQGPGLYVLPKGGSARLVTPLSHKGAEFAVARWSPDDSKIAFGMVDENFIGIRIVSAGGANLVTMPFHATDMGYPEWTEDGRGLIVSIEGAGGWRLWRIDLKHNNRLRALPYSGWVSVQCHDNDLYGMRIDRPGIWRISGGPRQLTFAVPTPEHAYQWRIAGDQLLYVDDPSSAHPHIVAQPLSGGPSRLYAPVPHFFRWEQFAVDPDDGSIVYPSVRSFDQEIELLHLAKQ